MQEASEHTPLINGPPVTVGSRKSTLILRDCLRLLKLTIPIALSFALQNVVQASSIIIVGRLGARQLDIASYGYMFATCTGSMVAIGGATALDTLCSQVISSAKFRQQPTLLGIPLQQCLFVLTFLFIFIVAPIWVFSSRLFLLLGQEHWLAAGTGWFLICMLPASYCQMIAECLKKYCQIQGRSNAVGVIVFIAAMAGITANLLLVNTAQLGVDGAPLAFLIYQLVTVMLLICLLTRSERREQTIRPIRKWSELTHDISTNAFLALTGLATIATEWWSFEILAIMAARLSVSEVSAQSILMSADLIFTTISLGIGVASSHMIGALLGAGQPFLAQQAVLAPYALSFALGAIEFTLIMIFHSSFGYMFTSDREVVEETAKVLPLMAIFQVLDLSNGGAGGILRGARRNHLSGMCNFFAYYGVGITMAWVLCFRLGWGLAGLWAGIITGSGALLVLQSGCIWTLQWTKVAIEASGESA